MQEDDWCKIDINNEHQIRTEKIPNQSQRSEGQ